MPCDLVTWIERSIYSNKTVSSSIAPTQLIQPGYGTGFSLHDEFYAEFCGIHGMFKRGYVEEENDAFCASPVGMIRSLLMPNCLTLHTSIMDSVVI